MPWSWPRHRRHPGPAGFRPLRRAGLGHAAGHQGPGAAGPGDAHRDVGAPRHRSATSPSFGADGHHFVGPATGALAGGDEGIGRMAEPEEIVAALETFVGEPSQHPRALSGVKVLVTAGGTREAIDPVRFIGNRSSGKMGHAIADEAARRGADVALVTTADRPSHPAVKVIRVESAQEMADAAAGVEADVAVMAAAVADFRPAGTSLEKLARADGPPEVHLERTPDVLASVAGPQPQAVRGRIRRRDRDRERDLAASGRRQKARRKKVDLLVANDVTEPGAGFGGRHQPRRDRVPRRPGRGLGDGAQDRDRPPTVGSDQQPDGFAPVSSSPPCAAGFSLPNP